MDNIDLEKKTNNPLHKKIGNIIQDKEFPYCKIVKDGDCGGKHNIPLFCSKKKKHHTNYCEVDLLIIKDSKIKVLLEIEESGITPIKVFGKFLASALSSNYIYKTDNYEMADSVTFIQILGTSKLEEISSKPYQFDNIEKSIQNIIPIKDSKLDKYKLFFGDSSDFNEDKLKEIISFFHEVLK